MPDEEAKGAVFYKPIIAVRAAMKRNFLNLTKEFVMGNHYCSELLFK